mgnify:CR=1 FL=1|jgi:hypothetical protein
MTRLDRYAQPLLQQAIAILLPPPPKEKEGPRPPLPPIPQRCHAATLVSKHGQITGLLRTYFDFS